MPTHNDYVTAGEFTRWVTDWRTEESNFRARLESRLESQHNLIKGELGEIKGMVKEANGKTSRNAESIAVVQRELEAIKAEDALIDRAVTQIREHGCAQLERHEAVVTTLGWSPKRKAAVAGGLLGTGALIWPALQQIAATVHDLVERLP